jgi:hypothetical protein
MRVNGIQCDTCCKEHKVDMEYDAQNLPQGWFTVIPGQGGGFVETVHFCSLICLRTWVDKRWIVQHGEPVAVEYANSPGPGPLEAKSEVQSICEAVDYARKEYWKDL